MIKICSICGEKFETTRSFAKYCSDECRKVGHQQCGKLWRENNPDKYREARERENARRRRGSSDVQKPPPFLTFNGRPRTKICTRCGKQFTTEQHNQKSCPVCRQKQMDEILRREQAKRQLIELTGKKCAKAEGKPVKSLDDWIREARECNLDYGNYRALIAQGKTFDELKAKGGRTHETTD